MARRDDWPERLATVVRAAGRRPYALGEWDCLAFAFAAVAALTDVDHWPAFRGRYGTVPEAVAVIRRHADTLREAFGLYTGLPEVPLRHAWRGDVLVWRDAAGEHLGVCMGAEGLLLGPDGLQARPMADPAFITAFRVA